MKRLGLALALAYPLLAHGAALMHSTALTCAAALLLFTLLLLPALARGRIAAWAALGLLGAGLFWLQRHGLSRLPLYAAPVLLDLFVAWLFGHTLAAGREPLIARIIRVLDGPEFLADPAVRRYARALTRAWMLLMLGLATACTVLALLAVPDGLLAALGIASPLPLPQAAWSWFANVASYAIVAGFFVLEYAYRQHALPQQPSRSFREFLLRLARLWPALVLELRSGSRPVP